VTSPAVFGRPCVSAGEGTGGTWDLTVPTTLHDPGIRSTKDRRMNKCLRIAKPQAAEVVFTSEAFPYDDNN
jgi:hypothetical protein